MDPRSLTQQIQDLEGQLTGILSGYDVVALPRTEQECIRVVKNSITDVRLEIRDYNYADSRANQLANITAAKRYLTQLQQAVLKASENNIFSAIDVAQLSARIEQIRSKLT